MLSEIYLACENGDADLVQALIKTSPSKSDLNKVEINGNTALHIASSQGHVNIVQLLLYEYHVYPYAVNNSGLTAYQEASNDEIRQLFHLLERDHYRFASNESISNPFEVINGQHRQKSHWLHHYSSTRPISMELLPEIWTKDCDFYTAVFNAVNSFLFGIDPDRKKFEEWTKNIQSIIDRTFTFPHSQYFHACELLQAFIRTREIEYLLKLYTLDKLFSQNLGNNLHYTECFYAPIHFSLLTVKNRSYRGRSYRGLTMTRKDLDEYKYAFNHKESYVKTNTFCSTSVDRLVAEVFADSGNVEDEKVKVLMIFDFEQPCSTAITLFARQPNFQSISEWEEEREVLVLPGTIFSVTNVEEYEQRQFDHVYLKHHSTVEEEADIAEAKLQSFIETFCTD
ncbi:unnamed protein product [Rotaria sp. Silwood2]|nr:unnamed protein product [Rotaria sp. Silwood2]